MSTRRYEFSLVDISAEGRRIDLPGGYLVAAKASTLTIAETWDLRGDTSRGRDPVPLTYGAGIFAVDSDVLSIDVYGIAPTGHSFVAFGLKEGFSNLGIDGARTGGQMLSFPFDAADDDTWTANVTRTVTYVPKGLVFGTRPSVQVITADATEHITVGLASDPDGLIDDFSVATEGISIGSSNPATATSGVGTKDNRRIRAVLSAGSDTAAGLVNIPYYVGGAVEW